LAWSYLLASVVLGALSVARGVAIARVVIYLIFSHHPAAVCCWGWLVALLRSGDALPIWGHHGWVLRPSVSSSVTKDIFSDYAGVPMVQHMEAMVPPSPRCEARRDDGGGDFSLPVARLMHRILPGVLRLVWHAGGPVLSTSLPFGYIE
jgi:hypothetical protein